MRDAIILATGAAIGAAAGTVRRATGAWQIQQGSFRAHGREYVVQPSLHSSSYSVDEILPDDEIDTSGGFPSLVRAVGDGEIDPNTGHVSLTDWRGTIPRTDALTRITKLRRRLRR